MKRRTAAFVGIPIIAVLAFFLFVPAFDNSRPGLVVVRYGCGQGCDETLNANYSAQVSLSYVVFKCGIVQNETVSYFDTSSGIRQTGQSGNRGWFCGTLD